MDKLYLLFPSFLFFQFEWVDKITVKKDALLKLNFLKIYNGNLYPIIRETEVIFTETGDVKVSSSQFKIDDNFANKFYANNQYAF